MINLNIVGGMSEHVLSNKRDQVITNKATAAFKNHYLFDKKEVIFKAFYILT